jgi:multicomponent Na+:H+ antiporter subunit G
MTEYLMSALLLIGAVFLLLAAVGIIRMPDLYTRLQAAAKASTLGVGSVVLALAVHFTDTAITVRALLVVAFLFLTTPVAAHVIGRAAYIIGVPLWEKTLFDELRGHYDDKAHELEPGPYSGRAPSKTME